MTYYISPTRGNDNNTGKTTGSPWQHYPCCPGAIGNAAAHTPVAGDVYHILS
jgi:hypothetical protein